MIGGGLGQGGLSEPAERTVRRTVPTHYSRRSPELAAAGRTADSRKADAPVAVT